MSDKVEQIFGVPYPWSEEDGKGYLETLKGYVEIPDTDSTYPRSEKYIGDASLSTKFTIHTKAIGSKQGVQGHNMILECSLGFVITQVDTYYIHSPDPTTPLSETLEAIQKLYRKGAFKNFGISNFLRTEVQSVYDYMSERNYVLPNVYEGNYNPIGRHAETTLSFLLRKLGISINAYAALAGSFLVKSPDGITNGSAGQRCDLSTRVGQMHHKWYHKPRALERFQNLGRHFERFWDPKG